MSFPVLLEPEVNGWMPKPYWVAYDESAIEDMGDSVDLNELVPEARAYANDHLGAVDDSIVCLWVDPQNDFCHRAGSLFVGGIDGNAGEADTWRYGSFITGNVHRIRRLITSTDEHEKESIDHGFRLMDADGNSPEPFTMVTNESLRNGEWMVRPEYGSKMQDYYLAYTEELERLRGHGIVIWPYHCIEETVGALITPFAKKCCEWWGAVRGLPVENLRKSNHRDIEFYSIFRPDVRSERFTSLAKDMVDRGDRLLASLLHEMNSGARVVFGGEAASHCVGWSVQDFIEYILEERDDYRSLLRKIVVLTDCTSPIVVRDEEGNVIPGSTTDYRQSTYEMFDRWSSLGVVLAESMTPIDEWK